MNTTQTVVLTVEGMQCAHCTGSVKDKLTPLPGIENVEVILASGEVKVSGFELDPKFLIREIGSLGYSARVKA